MDSKFTLQDELTLLYKAARMAPLNAQDHEAVAAAANKIGELLQKVTIVQQQAAETATAPAGVATPAPASTTTA